MPKIRALTPEQAKRALASRFGRIGDNLRQLATNFGARPHRVFLTWTRWTGAERGEGDELLVNRVEILPTPKVSNLDSVSFSIFHAGTVPAGSVKVTEVSVARFTADVLRGFDVGVVDAKHLKKDGQGLLEPWDFFYEVVEDGRGDPEPERARFRLLSTPFRRATNVDWLLMLQRDTPDRSRGDRSPFGATGRL